MELMGTTEIGQRLGVTKQRADQLSRSHDDFPEPIAILAQGRVWRSEDVETWITAHPKRLPGRPRKEGS